MVFSTVHDQSISFFWEISGWCGALPQSAHRKERVQLQHCWPHGEFLGKSTGNQWLFLNNPAWSTMGNGPAKRWSGNQSLEILEVNHDRNLELFCQESTKGCVIWACHFKEFTHAWSCDWDLQIQRSYPLGFVWNWFMIWWISPSKWPSPTWLNIKSPMVKHPSLGYPMTRAMSPPKF